MKLGRVWLGVWGFLFFACSPLRAVELSSLYTHFKLYVGDTVYSVLYIEPHDMYEQVNRVAPELRADRERALISRYWDNHLQTGMLLQLVADHVETSYRDTGVVGEDSDPEFVAGIRKSILSGQMPLLAITDVNNPYKMHLTIGKGIDWGKGVPSEVRCLGRSKMLPIPKARPEVKAVPILALRSGESLDIDEELSALLSSIPRPVGANIELTRVAVGRHRLDLIPVAHRIFAKLGFWGKSGLRVPEGLQIPDLDEATQTRLEAAWRERPHLPRGLFFPKEQTHLYTSHVVAHALGAGRAKTFEWVYGFPQSIDSFMDPDRPSVEAKIWQVPLSEFEMGKTAHRLRERTGFRLVAASAIDLEAKPDMFRGARIGCDFILGGEAFMTDEQIARLQGAPAATLAPHYEPPAGSFFDLARTGGGPWEKLPEDHPLAQFYP
ncbi:MAG: hypothetical protein KDD51_16630 [Bdellovibrionales bacterium]|nr:hypothetical protein [Bdellovibrionales bacterium]